MKAMVGGHQSIMAYGENISVAAWRISIYRHGGISENSNIINAGIAAARRRQRNIVAAAAYKAATW